jgi:hypothetical protein
MLRNNTIQQKEVTLTDILDQFPNEGKELIWSIIDLDILGDFEEGSYYCNIISKIWNNEEDSTFFLSWNEIYEMSKKITVLTDFMLVGCKKKETISEVENMFLEIAKSNNYPLGKDIKPVYDILVDIDDGYLLGVYSKNKAIETRCTIAFGPFPALLYNNEAVT